MATRLPPPKRVKVYHGVPEPEPEPPKPSPNIVVQFVSEEDGRSLAPAVNLPANVSREQLEALLNKLSTEVRLIYRHPSIVAYFLILNYRMTTPFHSPSMCLYQKMKTRNLEHRHELSSLNHYRTMSLPIHQEHSHRKTYSSCIARLRASFALGLQRGAHPPCLVGAYRLYPFYSPHKATQSRPYFSHSLCIVLTNRQSPCHRIWRYHSSFMGFKHGDAFAYAHRTCWMGAMR
jgi:hypothetical protein